jgi:hypothetical protein
MAAWDPTAVQVAEADTLCLPDFTSITTAAADGVIFDAAPHASYESEAANYVLATDSQGQPSIRPNGTSTAQWAQIPADGVAAGDQLTIEWKESHPTTAWADLAADKFLFEIQTPTLYMPIKTDGLGGLVGDWAIFLHSTGALHVGKSFTVASVGVAAATLASFALVIDSGTVKFYIDGVLKKTVTGFAIPTVVSDDLRAGIRFAGSDNGKSGFAVSQVRISATARVPGQTPTLRSLTGSVTVDPTAASEPVTMQLGCLHGYPARLADDTDAVMSIMRTNKFLVTTPIKAGGTDATHPTLGASGAYSYDWQVVTRQLDLMHDHGHALWLTLAGIPQVLGGEAAPYSGTDLTTKLPYQSDDSFAAPSDNAEWAKIVGDLVAVVTAHPVTVAGYSAWNEPDVGWPGTQAEFITFYTATIEAINAVDADTPIIGGELAGIYGVESWIDDILQAHIDMDIPLGGFSGHDYTGDLRTTNDWRAVLDDRLTLKSQPTGLPLWLGEFNWSNRKLPTVDSEDPLEDFQHIRALGGSYIVAYVAHALANQATLNVGGIATAHITVIDETGYGDGDPLNYGWAGLQLIGRDGQHWALYNVMQGLQLILGDGAQVLSSVGDNLPPGVHHVKTYNPSTGRLGVALANYGWAALSARTVDLDLSSLSASSYRTRRWLVDPTHSSRWDTFQDDPAGSVDQDLVLASDTTGAAPSSLSVTVPARGSVFLAFDGPPSVSRLMKIDGTPVLIPA